MANAATVAPQAKKEEAAARRPVIPFVHAAHEQFQSVADKSQAITGATQQLGPFDIPANGYLRNVWLLVEASGGVLGPGVFHEDAPFNVLQNISLVDTNGAPILHPMDGYELFLINKWGGYRFFSDPESLPGYDATIGFRFALRIPVEISPANGLGALSNMNSASAYRLEVSLAASTTVFSTAPTTLPTVRLRSFIEVWSLPNASSREGIPQAIEPPMLGTTQYWTKHIVDVTAGENTIELPRVGNQIRNIITLFRNDDATPDRNDSEYPDPLRFMWDNRQMFSEPRRYREQVMGELYRYTRGAKDTGVHVYPYCHDVLGHPGAEDDGHLWLRTVSSSNLLLIGSFGGAGKLTVLTNDVAPAELRNRFAEESATSMVEGPAG